MAAAKKLKITKHFQSVDDRATDGTVETANYYNIEKEMRPYG